MLPVSHEMYQMILIRLTRFQEILRIKVQKIDLHKFGELRLRELHHNVLLGVFLLHQVVVISQSDKKRLHFNKSGSLFMREVSIGSFDGSLPGIFVLDLFSAY